MYLFNFSSYLDLKLSITPKKGSEIRVKDRVKDFGTKSSQPTSEHPVTLLLTTTTTTVKPPENSLFSWYIFELIGAVLVIVFVVAVVVVVRIKRQSEPQNIGNSTITQHIYSNIGAEMDEEIEIFVRSSRHSEQQNRENIVSMITQHIYKNTGAELNEETYL